MSITSPFLRKLNTNSGNTPGIVGKKRKKNNIRGSKHQRKEMSLVHTTPSASQTLQPEIQKNNASHQEYLRHISSSCRWSGINRNADSPVHAMPIAVQQIAGLNQSSRTQQKKPTENRSRSMNQKRLRWKPEEE